MIASSLDEPLGRAHYNKLILGIGTLGLLGYLTLITKGINRFPERRNRVLMYLITTLVFIILTINILMVINVEMIHFVQYAIMAILLFPLFFDFGESLFFATILGAIDEAYQYWVLAPNRTEYYDFNDVVINLLGAALGLIILFAVGWKSKKKLVTKWYKTLVSKVVFGLFALLFLLYIFGLLSIYPYIEDPQAPLLLIKKIQPEFWTIVHPDVKFHVLRPWSGVAISILLYQFYKRMGAGENEYAVN